MPKRKSEARSEEAIEFARDQRTAANDFSKRMWNLLRNKQCAGKKFRREHPIPPYTADFCCLEIKLTVEVDGEDHFTPEGLLRDKIRDRALAEKGFTVVRIPGFELMANPKAAFDKIAQRIDELETG